jgi:general bacterial porin, GBP family
MQNKKLLVVAIGAALAIPFAAHAQKGKNSGPEPDSVVELYGKAYPEWILPRSGNGPTPAGTTVSPITNGTPSGTQSIISRNEIEAPNTRLGVRGHENLGGRLKAIFQLETEFRIDQNNTGFATRDSFVGLDHPVWGSIKLGRMDTPFKKYGDDISFLGISSGNFVSTSNLLRKTGFGTSSASSFHLRRANAVHYETAQIAGFQGAAQYSTNETDTSTRHPHVWSFGLKWEGGPFETSVAYEKHWDLFGGSSNVPSALRNTNDQAVRSKDDATQVMVKYKIGSHQFEADYNWKKYRENATIAGRFSEYKNTAWELIWDARWSRAWRTQVAYIKADKGTCSIVSRSCNTDGLDGWQFQVGAAYYFSSRTYLFAIAAILHNGFSAQYNNSDAQAPSIGEGINQYALGISHSW